LLTTTDIPCGTTVEGGNQGLAPGTSSGSEGTAVVGE